jgi:hypothetical protein
VVSLCRLKQCLSLHMDTTPPQPNHTVTPTHIEPEQYNTRNKSTISRKLLKMNVLTFETCWAVNSEIIKQVTSSWSIFVQLKLIYFLMTQMLYVYYEIRTESLNIIRVNVCLEINWSLPSMVTCCNLKRKSQKWTQIIILVASSR